MPHSTLPSTPTPTPHMQDDANPALNDLVYSVGALLPPRLRAAIAAFSFTCLPMQLHAVRQQGARRRCPASRCAARPALRPPWLPATTGRACCVLLLAAARCRLGVGGHGCPLASPPPHAGCGPARRLPLPPPHAHTARAHTALITTPPGTLPT